jgi:hypothetical protein
MNTHTDDYSGFQAEATAYERNLLVLSEARYVHRRVPLHVGPALPLINVHLGDA